MFRGTLCTSDTGRFVDAKRRAATRTGSALRLSALPVGLLGRADDRPRLTEGIDDLVAPADGQPLLVVTGKVVAEQTPQLIGCRSQRPDDAPSGIRRKVPSGVVGNEKPSSGDRARHLDGNRVARFGTHRAQPERVRPPQAFQDRPDQCRLQIAGPIESLQELLSMNPVLGELADLVEPDRNQIGARL